MINNLLNHNVFFFSLFIYTDLTTSYGYYGSFYFPIRPPSPFADDSIPYPTLSLYNEDNNSHGMITWSSPTKPKTINSKSEKTSSSGSITKAWRRALNKFLKRTKSNKHKKGSFIHCYYSRNQIIDFSNNFRSNPTL